mmetsp:Transcript_55816/g.120643  ORF Transcript_55816/g.120643 Transcript_55816/m.120643 type:complete len:242 (-) Transcript_55816:447-1172(-)
MPKAKQHRDSDDDHSEQISDGRLKRIAPRDRRSRLDDVAEVSDKGRPGLRHHQTSIEDPRQQQCSAERIVHHLTDPQPSEHIVHEFCPWPDVEGELDDYREDVARGGHHKADCHRGHRRGNHPVEPGVRLTKGLILGAAPVVAILGIVIPVPHANQAGIQEIPCTTQPDKECQPHPNKELRCTCTYQNEDGQVEAKHPMRLLVDPSRVLSSPELHEAGFGSAQSLVEHVQRRCARADCTQH